MLDIVEDFMSSRIPSCQAVTLLSTISHLPVLIWMKERLKNGLLRDFLEIKSFLPIFLFPIVCMG